MRHNDYEVIGHCGLCGKPVYRPAQWTVYFNKKTKKRVTVPKYATCNHKGRK
jgi:hypothetical protein